MILYTVAGQGISDILPQTPFKEEGTSAALLF